MKKLKLTKLGLSNREISENYRDFEFWLMKSDFMGALAYWLVTQSPYDAPDITASLIAFGGYLDGKFDLSTPQKFNYGAIEDIINEDAFIAIPEIEKFNHSKINGAEFVFVTRYDAPEPDCDFIDMNALARNVLSMICREAILNKS